jgi:AraC-like DNA-binding protein
VSDPAFGLGYGRGRVNQVLASWALPLADALDELGEDAETLFKQVRIDLEAAQIPGSRIPTRALDEAWELAVAVTGDRMIGLRMSQHVHPGTFDAVGYAIYASLTLADSCERIRNYFRVLSSAAVITVDRTPERLKLDIAPTYAEVSPARALGLLATLVKIWREMYRQDFAPLRVELIAPADGYTEAEIERLLSHFGCPIDIGSTSLSVTVTSKDAQARLRTANAGLAQRLDAIALDFAQQLENDSLGDRVMLEVIQHLPSGKTSLNDIAYELKLAPRTLQRRLAEEGVSFQTLLDNARRRLAEAYLQAGDKSPKMMAYLLGFSDVSHFSRAVKVWFGKTPGQMLAHSGSDANYLDD